PSNRRQPRQSWRGISVARGTSVASLLFAIVTASNRASRGGFRKRAPRGEQPLSIVTDPQSGPTQNPTQSFGTEGVKPMGASFVTRFFMRVVGWAERLNLKCSKVGNPPIYNNAVFPWAAEIEREWRAIRRELAHVLTSKDTVPGFHEIASDVETISSDRGWKTFLLSGYGFKSDANIGL